MAWTTPATISAARTIDRAPRGFTLLEIVIVLVIASVVIGGAVGVMVYSSDERALRNASGEIELLAKRARSTAVLLQTPYALEFREGVVRLMPLAEAGQIERRTKSGRRVGGEEVQTGNAERWEYPLEPGIEAFVRRWNSDVWHAAREDAIHVWRFDPTGLCEPISVRLTLNDSWMEDTYHPLSASIRETQMEAR
jgi:prepilin-type N-terminal cleavage/methylation domain-containing protein